MFAIKRAEPFGTYCNSGYRQATYRKQARIVHAQEAWTFNCLSSAIEYWRYSSYKNKEQKLNIYVKVRTETLICKLIILF